jgi:hypothetical protein
MSNKDDKSKIETTAPRQPVALVDLRHFVPQKSRFMGRRGCKRSVKPAVF